MEVELKAKEKKLGTIKMEKQVKYVEFWLMLASVLVILATIILCFLKLQA